MSAAVRKASSETFQRKLEALFRKNHQLIYRAAYGVTGNPRDAEVVLQTVFLGLLQGSIRAISAGTHRDIFERRTMMP